MVPGFAYRWFKERRRRDPRVTVASFGWHYNVSQDDEYEAAITRLRQGVAKNEFAMRVDDRAGTALPRQPVWDLLNPPQVHDLMDRNEWEPETIQPDGIYSDAWARYRPFHSIDRPAGISLWADGVASCATALRDALRSQGSTLTDRVLIVWAMSFLYLHELVHQIVEDVVTALEFRVQEDIYLPARTAWSGYLVMEEALANSFAFSYQSDTDFFERRSQHGNFEASRLHQAQYDRKPYSPEPEPAIDPPVMLKVLESVMKSQPAGYRDSVRFTPELLYDNLLSVIALLYLQPPGNGLDRHGFHRHQRELDTVFQAFRTRCWPRWEDVTYWGEQQ